MGVRLGLLGLTHPHSAAYLRTLDALDAVDSVAPYDPDPGAGELALRGCRKTESCTSDLTGLLARQDLPIVLVALPTREVPAVLLQAARAGKHLICEKPCARSAAELRPLLPVLAERNVQFTACYLWRANPAMRQMRTLVQAGALGRLTSLELRMVTTQVRLRDPRHWLFEREVAGGGILAWLGCHWLDLLRFLTEQEMVSVSAMTATISGESIDVEDTASVSFRLSGGALGSLYAGYLLPSGRPGYEGAAYDQAVILRGTLGTLSHTRDGDEQVVTLESSASGWRSAPQQVFRFRLPPTPAYGGAHGLAFLDDFIRLALTGEGKPLVTVDDALRVLELLDALYRSAQTGQVIAVPEASPCARPTLPVRPEPRGSAAIRGE